MSSYINYRFLSSKAFTKLAFQGTTIPLWELRTEIIQHQKMFSNDFDLLFYEDDLTTPIHDDYTMIHRNANIIIKRIPIWMSKRSEAPKKAKEKDSIRTVRALAAKPLFSNYICHRCGQKGHFIQNCPTNTDKNYDHLRIRKPTGIPKAFLKQVEGEKVCEPGMMVTETGLLKVEPQLHEWRKLGEGNVNLDVPSEMKCPVCGLFFNIPVRTSCGHLFCESCLSLKSFCVLCERKIEDVQEDFEMRERIEKFIDENEKKRRKISEN